MATNHIEPLYIQLRKRYREALDVSQCIGLAHSILILRVPHFSVENRVEPPWKGGFRPSVC